MDQLTFLIVLFRVVKVKRRNMEQLAFGFLADVDKEFTEKQERERIESRQRNEDGHLDWTVNNMPPLPEEWNIILMGIRLCRHIHPRECHGCKLDTSNHCPEALGNYWDEVYKTDNPIKVCLKDYFDWCARNGRKDLIKKQLYRHQDGILATYS